MKKIYLILIISFSPIAPRAQQYFQQDVKYTIHVKLDDLKHELSANEIVEYTNNSQDTLTFLYFHLWPNAYKNNSTAFAKQLLKNGNTKFYYSDDSQKGYIDSLDFKVNDEAIKWELNSENIDICKLILNKPLIPGQSITISTPFHVKIPSSFSRIGHEGQSYQISQWYPKPAVYDINGWNQMPYLNQGEFYSEFGIFDVYITLPENYVVGSTGDLVDGEKEFAWLNEKAIETSKINVFNKKNIAFPPSSNETKTLHYHQEKIHDFAWFADKRYNVLKGEVELPDSKRKVTTWIMFTNYRADIWKNGIEYVNDAIYYYSKWIGEYPYNQATALEGSLSAGGGMEYPNVTVISAAGDAKALEMVIIHEVGHNWFYGILGSNERKYPWMDEGINSFYEYRYLQTKYPGSTLFLDKIKNIIHLPAHYERSERSLFYEIASHLNNDQPIGLPAEEYTNINYGGSVYAKTAIAMAFLKEYLKENKFDYIMQDFFYKWKYKHPQPIDLQNIMELNSGEKLNWFFDDMIKTTKKIDYKICKIKPIKDSLNINRNVTQITIKNKGEINAPFEITAYLKDSVYTGKWFDGIKGKQKELFPFSGFDKLSINSENNCPEYNRKNNEIKTKGIFKKSKPLLIQLFPGIDDPSKAQICTTPVIGFNKYNGLMPGIAIYNNPLPQKKFSYFLMPLYGTSDNTFDGFARTGFAILPEIKRIQLIWIGVSGSHFSYADSPFSLGYTRLIPEILIKFKNKNFNVTHSSELRFRNINIRKDIVKYTKSGDIYNSNKTISSYYVNQIIFSHSNFRKINPYNINIVAEQGSRFLKTFLETTYKISYNKPGKSFDIRTFIGGFIFADLPIEEDFRFKLSGLQGYRDYLFDHYYIGRASSTGILSQQFCETDGGFKIFTPAGQTWNWLFALNLKTNVPGKVPFKLFADFGAFPDKEETYGTTFPVFYDAGIQLSIINNIFDIYFPFIMSNQIKEINKISVDNYFQNIRFTLSLEKIDPFKLLLNIR